MDTMKDTKMQPATDAVIDNLRKAIADCYWPISPVTINEILDRLEAAERERDGVAQQLVQSEQGKRKISKECESYKAAYNDWTDKTEWVQQGFDEGTIPTKYLGMHRADVMARLLDAAEKERDALRAVVRHEADCVEACKSEIDRLRAESAGFVDDMNLLRDNNAALRARIEEMERQEPVAWYSKQYGFVYMSRHSSQFKHGSILYLRNGTPALRIEGSSRVALLNMASLPHGTVFYALPGAKGDEK